MVLVTCGRGRFSGDRRLDTRRERTAYAHAPRTGRACGEPHLSDTLVCSRSGDGPVWRSSVPVEPCWNCSHAAGRGARRLAKAARTVGATAVGTHNIAMTVRAAAPRRRTT